MAAAEHFDADAFSVAVLPAVLDAGRLEMAHFKAGVAIERKPDKSPVTIADREAEAILVSALSRIAPSVPIVAEEAVTAGHIPAQSQRYFLVDALDGTRLFIKGVPEFSINIALVVEGKPVFGLIYGPAIGALYLTRSDSTARVAELSVDSEPDFKNISFNLLATRPPDLKNLLAYNSQSSGGRTAGLLSDLGVREARPFGSSLKFCLIAAGQGDFYARLGDTNEWDTAAGQAILEAAGGSVTTLDGQPLTYGHAERSFLNPNFIAWGRQPLKTWPVLPPTPAGA